MISNRFVRCLAVCLVLLAPLCPARALDGPVVVGNNRITFITDCLVRLEYALDGAFLDDSTLFAVDRRPRHVDVKVERQGRKYIFTTRVMRLEYDADGCPFGQNNVKATWRQAGRERSWCLTDEQGNNLLGPVATLDAVADSIPRQEGLLSRDGWYLIDDSGRDVYKNGWLHYRPRTHVQDFYLFVYGTDYKAALRSLAAVSGPAPMPRKYVHGAWYCRWWPYTDQDYRDIVDGYKQHDFPMDVLVFDMDWHRKDALVGMGHAFTRGWTGYSWNRKLIPHPATLIGDLKKEHIYVTLNDHPHDGIRPHEDMYVAFMKDLGRDTARGVPPFDAGDPAYMRAFLRHAHGQSDSMGVAFWWLDWQQDYAFRTVRGTTTKHVPWLNELYFRDSQKNGLRGQGFSRWGGWGDHRHPIQFSGDAVGNWNVLRFEVDLTTTSGNAGCFFWAHDIGGFYDGTDPELYVRWTQFGLLNSSLRIHSVANERLDRRPWLWGARQERAMRRIYHLRSQLMPYIYSSVRQCHTDMLPLNRGLYIEQPEVEASCQHPGQFLFGDLILGAPVAQPATGPDSLVRQSVYFPAGADWYSLFNGRRYEGGTTQTLAVPLEESPVFVKGGWPLPMQPYTPRMASTPLDTLVVRCYPGRPGADNTYTLYEDDGLTTAYERDLCATTPLTYSRRPDGVRLALGPTTGSYEGQPQRRAYRIELPGVGPDARVRVGGRRVKTRYDAALGALVVELGPTSIRRALTIDVR